MSPPLPIALGFIQFQNDALQYSRGFCFTMSSSWNNPVEYNSIDADGYNLQSDYSIDVDGYDLQSMNKLKDLYFDNYCLNFDDLWMDKDEGIDDNNDDEDNDNDVTTLEAMSDSNKYSNMFLFCNDSNWYNKSFLKIY